MTGLIWFVQVVHYPLMAAVGEDHFVAYELAHTQRTTLVVMPVMLLELATAAALIFWNVGGNLSNTWLWVNLIGLGLIWASTFFIQVPLHGQLSAQHSGAAIQQLVNTNWIRTFLWTARSALLLFLLFK